MPKFYFHMRDPDGFFEDPDGTDLPDIDAARRDAFVSARHILAEGIKRDGALGTQRFEICDGAGHLLADVPFRDAIVGL